MIQAFPKNRWLLLAGICFGYFVSLILRDISGLSYSPTIRLALREPAAILASAGAVLLVSLFLGLAENAFLRAGSPAWMGRLGMLILFVLCIAATVIWLSLPATWILGSTSQ